MSTLTWASTQYKSSAKSGTTSYRCLLAYKGHWVAVFREEGKWVELASGSLEYCQRACDRHNQHLQNLEVKP